MVSIYVDGDACPVKDEVVRVAERYSLQVYLVSNKAMRPDLQSTVKAIVVGPEFDAADDWIVEHIIEKDVVITADIQLAARCLKGLATAVGPTGKIFSSENIGPALAMRDLSSYLREAGEIKGSNPPFSKADRSQFLQSLDLIVSRALRGGD